jgi:integrase
MDTTFDVRIYKTDVWVSKRKGGKTTYWVRWRVGKQPPFKLSYATSALAESFRSQLVAAAGEGKAFRLDDGLPVSMARQTKAMGWYDLTCAFADMKWPHVAATTRRTHAEALTAATVAMLTDQRGKPDDKIIRRALCRWAYNTNKRDDPAIPADVASALLWVKEHCRDVAALNEPEVLRHVLNSMITKLDRNPYASSVSSRRRKILGSLIGYAVEKELLERNPIPALQWTPPRTSHVIDRRRVPNPIQTRSLLNAVGNQRRSGPRLKAFFGCLYYAALRPEEAVALAKSNLALPTAEWDEKSQEWMFAKGQDGWGELQFETAEPHAGKEWTDSGNNRDHRQLKQRARGESRIAPCCPDLTVLLLDHMRLFGTAADGRLFTGERNSAEVPKLTIVRTWQGARTEVFTEEVAKTMLAKTPYDLRHAAVSTWLNGGVPPTTVAEWAGHSLEVLLKIYAKCLDGTDAIIRRRVQDALGHVSD